MIARTDSNIQSVGRLVKPFCVAHGIVIASIGVGFHPPVRIGDTLPIGGGLSSAQKAWGYAPGNTQKLSEYCCYISIQECAA